MINLENEIGNLELGELGNELENHSDICICEAINEIAYSNIYTNTLDLLSWAKSNIDYIITAYKEYGESDTFLKEIKRMQYFYNADKLYKNLNNIIKYYALEYIKDKLGRARITEEEYNKLNDELQNVGAASSRKDIIDIVNDVF